jgi:hypothetical protein
VIAKKSLVDDERFLIVVPMNYGSCYTFNNSAGFQASFCTGSSSGERWFKNYAPDGPVISVFDKENADDVNGKWQIHAPTNQINNGNQSIRSDEKFSELFPGLMKRIVAGIESNAAELKTASEAVARGGYDIPAAVADLKKRFPLSYASSEAKPEEPEEPQVDANDGPGVYVVTQTASGRTARIEGESRQDVITKLTTRYPDSTEADYTIEKAQA